MTNWIQAKSLKQIHDVHPSESIQSMYYIFESTPIALFRFIPPVNKYFYGLSINPHLVKTFSNWAVNIVGDKECDLIIDEYKSKDLNEYSPTSLHPVNFPKQIEFFTPSQHIASIKSHFESMRNDFESDQFIDKQWTLSDPDLGNNYEDYLKLFPEHNILESLIELYSNLKSNQNHPLFINKNIRFQCQISLSLLTWSFDAKDNMTFSISDINIVYMAIVNLLRWPNLYSCTELVQSQMKQDEMLNKTYKIGDIVLDFKTELDSYNSFIEQKFPSLMFDLEL